MNTSFSVDIVTVKSAPADLDKSNSFEMDTSSEIDVVSVDSEPMEINKTESFSLTMSDGESESDIWEDVENLSLNSSSSFLFEEVDENGNKSDYEPEQDAGCMPDQRPDATVDDDQDVMIDMAKLLIQLKSRSIVVLEKLSTVEVLKLTAQKTQQEIEEPYAKTLCSQRTAEKFDEESSKKLDSQDHHSPIIITSLPCERVTRSQSGRNQETTHKFYCNLCVYWTEQLANLKRHVTLKHRPYTVLNNGNIILK